LTHFRGSELQNYFTRILEDNLKGTVETDINIFLHEVARYYLMFKQLN